MSVPSVLFVEKYTLHRMDNLRPKFDGQLAAARNLGFDVAHLGWDEAGVWLVQGEEKRLLVRSRFAGKGWYAHTLLFFHLIRAARRACKQRRYDVLYVRYIPFPPSAAGLGRAQRKAGGKLVMEIPTYPQASDIPKKRLYRLLLAMNNRFLRRFTRYVDLIALIGEKPDGPVYGCPTVNINNGVNARALSPRVPSRPADGVHLLLLATMNYYQGYDRLLAGYDDESKRLPLYFHLVGNDYDGTAARLMAEAERLGAADRWTNHGPQYGAALDALFDQCDVGVGGLGEFRRGRRVSTELKIRDYMGRGIPVAYAGEDDMLDAGADFLLQLPNDESPIHLRALYEFGSRMKGRPELPAQIRAYAAAHMSWRDQMRKVLERVLPGSCAAQGRNGHERQ